MSDCPCQYQSGPDCAKAIDIITELRQQLAEAQAENERLTRWRVDARAAMAKYHCPTCGGVRVAESELCTCDA